MNIVNFPIEKVRKTERQIYNENLNNLIKEVKKALDSENVENLRKFQKPQNG